MFNFFTIAICAQKSHTRSVSRGKLKLMGLFSEQTLMDVWTDMYTHMSMESREMVFEQRLLARAPGWEPCEKRKIAAISWDPKVEIVQAGWRLADERVHAYTKPRRLCYGGRWRRPRVGREASSDRSEGGVGRAVVGVPGG